jgi:hypothetical protein
MSTVSMPSLVAVIGPIVDPQAMLFRDENVCRWTPTEVAARTIGTTELGDVA